MKKITYNKTLFTAFGMALIALLAGCSRIVEPEGIGDNGFVNFSVTVSGEATATKGTMFDSESSLSKISATAWNNDTDNHDAFISGYKDFELTAGEATTDIRWKKPYAKVFYAYANLPADGASVTSSTYTGQTLTYTVPADAAQQKDILLASTASDGSTCTETTRSATLNFKHPLTALEFKVGEITGLTKITKISIAGIYASGSVTQNADGSFAAWSASGSQTVYQTISGDLPAKGSAVGVPFILIPQSAAKFSVAIEGVNNIGEDILLGGEIAASGGNVWAAGKKNVVTIDCDYRKKLSFTSTVANWGEGDAISQKLEKRTQQDDEIWYLSTDPNVKVSFGTFKDKDGKVLSLLEDTLDSAAGYRIAKYNGAIHTLTEESCTNSVGILTKFLVPPKAVRIEDSAFKGQGNDALTYVYLPDSVTDVSYRAFNHLKYNPLGFEIETSRGKYSITNDGSIVLGNGTIVNLSTGCFVKGTLISLADGTTKKVEDLTYDDNLLVWNFDEGRYDSAKLLWITKSGLISDYYCKVTLSDGTILKLTGSKGNCHRLFNYTDKKFEYANQITPGKEVFTENGIVTLVSCELIEEEVEYYNLITNKHINCFANGILAASHFNNVYPIDEEMKFVKDGRKIRPWSEFRKAFKKAGISKDWYEGVRLGEQPDELDDVVNRLAKKEARRQPCPEQPGFFSRIWNWIKELFSK